MNKKVLNKIESFFNGPKHIFNISNINDRNRIYEIAIAIHQEKESLEDVKKYIKNNLPKDFLYPEKILSDCFNMLSVLVPFLDSCKSTLANNFNHE